MRFPYGLADFRKIREEGYFYVDRTDRIALIEEVGHQLLFLRPRRFGKSLWLSTLENYYDLARAGDFERLFGGLKIGQNPTPRRNRYFVLKLNFSLVNPSGDQDAIRQALYQHVNSEIQAFNLRYQHALPQPVAIHGENALSSLAAAVTVQCTRPGYCFKAVNWQSNVAHCFSVRMRT